MDTKTAIAAIAEQVERLRSVSWKEREAVREAIGAIAVQVQDRVAMRDHLEEVQRGLGLELRWEIDAVLELLAEPPPEPEEEPEAEEEEEDPNRQLSASDLDLVYHDPRGLLLYKSKRGERWFATQADPMTGQPQTFELPPEQVDQVKAQLAGSPYWVLGAGA